MRASMTHGRVCARRPPPAPGSGVLAAARSVPIVLGMALLAACSGGARRQDARSAGGTARAVTHAPVAWPSEPAPSECGETCGDWLPYTRFQQPVRDPRTQDPSNGGTAPQNYVNVSSSCTDKALPSIYYALHKDPDDPSKDVIFFRWRVEQAAHTYATGPAAGIAGASDPWSSALWTVLIDVDGSGYRQLAAHINGSSGSPSAPIDTLAAIYGRIPTQSIDYENDPVNIKLLGTSPTAFVDGGTGKLLNFRNAVDPVAAWPNGAGETTWDYGPTRARLVSTRPCTEYFVDYQIPVAMLDATAQGGPKVTRSTPIAMLFCTANSLNNPLQKDCALRRTWNADAASPGPFGDYISFDQTRPYAQPIISKVTSTPPSTCGGTYTLGAQVQDSLYVNGAGVVVPSVKQVSFWYYYDANGDGVANDGSVWTFAADASPVPGTMNGWTASWDSRTLARGNYLIGAQAVDDNTRVDDGMTPTGVDNRTFSYVTSDSVGQVYVDGAWQIAQSDFPVHAPARSTSASENWYGNPLITGLQVSGTGIDIALNSCGVAPILSLSGAPSSLDPGQEASLSVSVSNAGNPRPTNVSSLSVLLPPGFAYVGGSSAGMFGTSDPEVNGTTLTWTVPGAPVTVAAAGAQGLSFRATATATAGQYNATATAATTDGTLTSGPAAFTVYAAAATLGLTPSRYAVAPDGATQVTYTLAYGNASGVPLANATLTDVLPASVAYVSCSGGATCASGAGTVTFTLGTLAAGASGTATLTVTVGTGYGGTSLTDTATLSAVTPGGAPVQRSAAATISVTQPMPLYSLTASSSDTTIAPSSAVTWTLSYANPGNGTAAGTLLVDTLPAGFTFSSCSVSGSPHFTSCASLNGTVTFSGASGAAVPLPAGASGTVTVTATAAASPFTYTNPAVDRATLSGAVGVAPATATASVGVNGQYCSNVFYFHQGADNQLATLRPANTAAPVSGTDYSTAITSVTNNAFGAANQVAFLQDTGFAQPTDLSGQTATINFNLYAKQGGTDTQVVLQKVSGGTTTTMATSSTLSIGTNHNWYTYSFIVPGGTTMGVGDKLQWLFQFKNQGGQKDISFSYDSTTYDSRSSFCTPTAPAALAVANRVDKTAIPGSPVEVLTYTVTASNLGGTAASNVTLTDALAAGMTGCESSTNGSTWTACSSAGASPPSHTLSIATLAAGASTTLYLRGTSPAAPSVSPLVDTATLSGAGLATVSASASTTLTAVGGGGAPSLVVTAAADRGTVSPGQTVTYTLTVVNVGTAPATDITVSDALPTTSWYHYVAASAQGGSARSVSGDTLSFALSSLAVGASAALSFQMAASATGLPDGLTPLDDAASLSDASACTGSTPPAGCTSDTVTVLANGSASLTLSAGGSPGAVSPGAVLEYTLLVGSTGSSTATGVVLEAALPPHARYRSASLGGVYDAVQNRVVYALGDLGSGLTSAVSFRVEIDSTLPAGSTSLASTSTVSASNAAQQLATVTTTGAAAVDLHVSSAGPASLPGPAAHLAAAAAGAAVVTVDTSAFLEVGGYVQVGGAVARITGIAGKTVQLASPVTAAAGAPLYRSAVYAVTTSNQGTATANDLLLTAQVPAGWSYVSASPSPTAAPSLGTSGTVIFGEGSLPAGSVAAAQLVLIPTQTAALASSLSDAVDCLPATPGCTASASTSTVVGGLTAGVRTDTPIVSGGQTASYTITLSNSLATDVAGVAVTDVLPSGFDYLAATGVPAPSSVASGQPSWSGLTVPANGSLELTFRAAVSAAVGTGTYDDPVTVTAGGGTGVTPFDALATADDDVTVLDTGWSLAAGYVFRDRAPLGTLDGSDTGLPDVAVDIDDGSGQPFVARTDGYGYFRQLVRAGATWMVSVPGDGPNAGALAGLVLHGSYVSPIAAASTLRFGFVPPSSAPASIAVVGGDGQATPVTTGFGQPLVVLVTDGGGHPVPGASVTFTAPAHGASATITGVVVTDVHGTASSSATAGSTAGAYAVLARVSGVDAPASFSLTNLPGAATSLRLVSGGKQSTRVGTAFGQRLVAEALDAYGNPVPAAAVTFTPPAGSPGALLTPTAPVTTDALGRASVAAAADVAPGSYAVLASLPTGLKASFQLTNTSAAPLVIAAISGGGQSAGVATDFAAPLVARVTRDGSPVAGATVTFSAPASGASALLSASTVQTDADGFAHVSATATTVSGDYQVAASCAQASAVARFAETNVAGAPATLILGAGSSPQAAQVGTPFANALVATLVDGYGNPVPSRTVTFTPPSTGASAALEATEGTSDANGQVAIAALAKGTAAPYAIGVSSPGVAAASFLLTNLVGAPAYVTVVSGTPQRAAPREDFAQALVARVTDVNGDPVAGAEVTWTVRSSGAAATLSAERTVTDADGLTQVLATAGTAAGRYEVTASVTDGAVPALFELATVAGAPTVLTLDARTAPQSTGLGTAFPLPLRAHVADGFGNPVAGVTVTFAPDASTSTAVLSTVSVTSDASGDVLVEAVAGAAPGTYAVAAAAAGLAPVSFTLTNLLPATPAPTLAIRSGGSQSTVATTPFAEPLVVRVLDGSGAPLEGTTVHLALPSSGPRATAADTAVSDAQGEVRFTLTALDELGTFTVTASALGAASPVTAQFTVTAIPTVTTVRATPSSPGLSDDVTLEAQVSSERGTPPGSLRFTVDGAEIATATLAEGRASLTVPAARLGLGSHAVGASYVGAAPFAASAATDATIVVSTDHLLLDGGGGCASSGGGGGWLVLVAVSALLLRRRRRAGILAVLLAALTSAGPAHAQTAATVDSPGAAVNVFSSSPAGSRWAEADSLSYGGNGRLALRALLDYARRPLVLYDAHGSVRSVVLADQLWLHVGASVVVRDRFRLSLTAPVAIHQSPRPSVLDGVRIDPVRSGGIGDLAIGGDVLLLGAPQGAVRLGAGVGVLLPTGAQKADLGDGHLGASLHVNGAGQVGILEWAAEAGYAHRTGARIGGVRFGPGVRVKVAAGVRLLGDALLIGPELYGNKDVGGSAGAARPLAVEGDLGARYQIARDWAVRAGFGTGLKRSAGIPDWRALAGIEWSPGASPAHQEQAAPEHDRGSDAVVVRLDEAGASAEEGPSPAPAQPAPAAPAAAEPARAAPDVHAPDEEVLPDAQASQAREGQPLVRRVGAKLVGLEPVHFRNDRAIIEPTSFALLTEVSRLLLQHPEIARVRVEGHTDGSGARAHNVDLSRRRAQAVVDFLVGKGVPGARLEAQGFGPDRPIADDETVDGRAANRRVEFVIVGGEGAAEE